MLNGRYNNRFISNQRKNFNKRVIDEINVFKKSDRDSTTFSGYTFEQNGKICNLARQRGLDSEFVSGGVSKSVLVKKPKFELKCPTVCESDVDMYLIRNNIVNIDTDINDSNLFGVIEKQSEENILERDKEAWLERWNKIQQKIEQYGQPVNELPITKEKDSIIAAIKSNIITIITGETGCGKSTQVPQMILNDKELGPEACIICCQSRRISSISLATRVAQERGEEVGDTIAYSIRFDSKWSSKTQLEYVTTGLLLRRLNNDPKLEGITHLIIDEAHERDQFLDFLLVYVKDKLLKLNPNIHVIIMSATFQVDKFMEYLPGSKHIQVTGREYDVEDIYLEDIKYKYTSAIENNTNEEENDLQVNYNLVADIIRDIHLESNDPKEGILVFLPGWKDICEVKKQLEEKIHANDMNIILLHSEISAEDQNKVFIPTDGDRKVVLSTNIAETSVTMDEISYVIDTGLANVNVYNPKSGVTSLTTEYISQANVIQRKGRAGRTKNGICYHLYTKNDFMRFEPYPIPEIQRMSLDEVILRSRSLDRQMNFRVEEFLGRLLDPPERENVMKGLSNLISIGALTNEEKLTRLGHFLVDIPLQPNYAKLLLFGVMFKCFDSILKIISILSVKDIFKIHHNDYEKNRNNSYKKRMSRSIDSDFICYLNIFNELEELFPSELEKYCEDNFLLLEKVEYAKNIVIEIKDILIRHKIIERQDLLVINKYSNNFDYINSIITMGLYPNIACRSGYIKNSTFINKDTGGYIFPGSCISRDSFIRSRDTTVIVFNELCFLRRSNSFYKMVSIINPLLLLLLCHSLDYKEKVEVNTLLGDCVYRINNNYSLKVNRQYLNKVLKLKCNILMKFNKFLENPHSYIVDNENEGVLELLMKISNRIKN